jgi:hypothetical protein
MKKNAKVKKMRDLASIHETAMRCRSDGLPIAEKALRAFVKSGELPAVQTGRKSLIYYPNVLEFVRKGTTRQQATSEGAPVRRIAL